MPHSVMHEEFDSERTWKIRTKLRYFFGDNRVMKGIFGVSEHVVERQGGGEGMDCP